MCVVRKEVMMPRSNIATAYDLVLGEPSNKTKRGGGEIKSESAIDVKGCKDSGLEGQVCFGKARACQK